MINKVECIFRLSTAPLPSRGSVQYRFGINESFARLVVVFLSGEAQADLPSAVLSHYMLNKRLK